VGLFVFWESPVLNGAYQKKLIKLQFPLFVPDYQLLAPKTAIII